MTFAAPYPDELVQVAKKALWYDSPENALADPPTFLAQLMIYGSSKNVAIVEHYVPLEDFRKVLEDAPAGIFTLDAWRRWHERLRIPMTPLPRRRFPDDSMGPEAGSFFGR